MERLEIPSSLLSSNMQIVDISSNRFNGVIQSSFSPLATDLTSFNASNNSFTDLIPSSICINSSNPLRILDFSFNNFIGHIPAGIGECSSLKIFRAGFNSLSGLIPNEIYNALELQEVSLPFGNLAGPISDNIVNLTNLSIVELYSNQLTGLIPEDIGKLFNLERLYLHSNNLATNKQATRSSPSQTIPSQIQQSTVDDQFKGTGEEILSEKDKRASRSSWLQAWEKEAKQRSKNNRMGRRRSKAALSDGSGQIGDRSFYSR